MTNVVFVPRCLEMIIPRIGDAYNFHHWVQNRGSSNWSFARMDGIGSQVAADADADADADVTDVTDFSSFILQMTSSTIAERKNEELRIDYHFKGSL